MKLTNDQLKQIHSEVHAHNVDQNYLNSTLKAKIESILSDRITPEPGESGQSAEDVLKEVMGYPEWIGSMPIVEWNQAIKAMHTFASQVCADKEREIGEVASRITELQEKYDENGYGYSAIVKLQRMEQHIDAALAIWQQEYMKAQSELDRLNESLTDGEINKEGK